MKVPDDKPTVVVKKGNLFDDMDARSSTKMLDVSPTADMTKLVHFGAETQGNDDPVVGWVVVVRGLGRGHSLPLGKGMNGMGRAANQRVKLDFGDTEISRESHAVITYEPRGRLFYLQHGGGINLTYLGLGDAMTPVLMPVVLDNGQFIQLGSTTLKFIALCGADFDWQSFV